MTSSPLPFPTRVQRSKELLVKHYWRCEDERCSDPSFHFNLLLPNGWGGLDEPIAPPTPGGPLVSLGLYRSATLVTAEVEVHACILVREVAPAHWLDIYLDRIGVDLLERREVKTEGGLVADVLTRSRTSDEPVITRWLAMKNYNRLFLIEGRAHEPNYPGEAETIYLAVSTLCLTHPIDWPLAERLLSFSRHLPGDFLLLYPESWTLTEDPDNDERALQIKLVQRVDDVAVGTIVFVTVARDAESDPQKLLQRYVDDLRRAGATLETPPLSPGEFKRDFENTWEATAPATLGPAAMETRAWLGERPDAWFFLAVFGPARAAADEFWAVNHRAFEIVLRYLKVP